MQEAVNVENGVSSEIAVTVPPEAISVSVTVDGTTEAYFALGAWDDSQGNVLVTPDWYRGGQSSVCLQCPNRIAAQEGAFAALAPNNQDARLAPGEHSFNIIGRRLVNMRMFEPWTGSVVVSVHAKVLPELPTAGIVDFNFHFTGAGGWTAENAASNTEFTTMLADVAEIYAQVGLSIGRMTYRDVDPSYSVIESIQGADSDFMALLAESEGASIGAINVFFVDEMMLGGPFGGFGLLLGAAGGIPGPVLVHGTARSGVVIALGGHDQPGAPTVLPNTVAHEVGHYLGLFHTSEMAIFGMMNDPIDDTPVNDSDYLMFNTGEGSTISPWQARVMLSNPWIRHAGGS